MNENYPTTPLSPHNVTPSTQEDGCPQEMPQGEARKWYAMRSTYCREMKAKTLLELDHFECFVPTRKERTEQGGKILTRQVPVVHNLIFIHSTRELITPWKRHHEEVIPLRYIIDKATGEPVVVSDKAMNDFIRVTQENDDSILYLDNPEVAISRGQRVEIIVGPFKGVQGHVLRIRRDRRVVITIEGLIAAAMAPMPQCHFKVVER